MKYSENSRGDGRGDCSYAKNHWSGNLKLDSVHEAQRIADSICRDLGLDRWTIKFSDRPTRRRRGTAWPTRNEIVLYKMGRNAGTLVHEVAHRYGRGHDFEYQRGHESCLKSFENNYSEFKPKMKASDADAALESVIDKLLGGGGDSINPRNMKSVWLLKTVNAMLEESGLDPETHLDFVREYVAGDVIITRF